MAVSLERFNRIIDISFITEREHYGPKITMAGAQQNPLGINLYSSVDLGTNQVLQKLTNYKSIICPRFGIKPDIQINGTLGADGNLWALHIMIKNFYYDLRTEQYSKVKIRVGYANKPITLEANILNMYQQTPGPEGTTVVECLYGNVAQKWLDTMVDLNYPKDTSLTDIIKAIKTKLNATNIHMGVKAGALKLDSPLQFEGSARNALTELEKRFQDKHLQTFMRGDVLCAICLTEGDCVSQHVLQYLSAPPQQNPGDSQGTWTTQITAPWMPEVMPGDEIIIPLQTYIRNGQLVGFGSKMQRLHVTKMSFHFGTKGSINQMTCDGYIVR
jgi:hypothetical protein